MPENPDNEQWERQQTHFIGPLKHVTIVAEAAAALGLTDIPWSFAH